MNDNMKKFIVKGFWIVILLFIIRCIISQPISAYDFFGFAGEAISVALIVLGVYECWLWQYNPLERIPKIKGEYIGSIEYSYNGSFDKKTTKITIRQSLLSINIKMSTDEITSSTITSNLILENDGYVLYYTYITNPKSKYSKENPIQYGTCRVNIVNNKELQGVYWTTRQTIGDITLSKID